jgi:hypothetical protein
MNRIIIQDIHTKARVSSDSYVQRIKVRLAILSGHRNHKLLEWAGNY